MTHEDSMKIEARTAGQHGHGSPIVHAGQRFAAKLDHRWSCYIARGAHECASLLAPNPVPGSDQDLEQERGTQRALTAPRGEARSSGPATPTAESDS
jgi:hypothetical protein